MSDSIAKQGWWNRNWESESTHLPTRWMYSRFEHCGRKSIHYIEFVIGSNNPCSRNVFLVPIKYIYMWPNVDGSKHQENQVKVTDEKRCSFYTLQENIQIVADLFRAFKKQITIQAKLSCCYCSGSVSILLHSTTCKNGVTLQCISQKKLQLLYLLHGTQ